MLVDAWIYALPSEWDAMAFTPSVESPQADTLSEFTRYVYDNAVSGWWNDYGLYRVYNVLADDLALAELVSNLTDVYAVYGWVQANGADSFDYQTVPADILAVMKDHIVYDRNGDVVSQTPADYENPNWGHIFYGQKERIFAGAFNNGFSEGFR